MSFLEDIALKRQSCRAYDPAAAVERDKLERCLEAARLAPSACNSQPYYFTVVTGELAPKVAKLTMLMGINKFATDVPVFVVISENDYNASAKLGSAARHQDYRSVDIGIAAAYFTSEAQSQGLSTCILGMFDDNKLRDLLGIEQRVRLVLAVGVAKQDDKLRAKKRKQGMDIIKFV